MVSILGEIKRQEVELLMSICLILVVSAVVINLNFNTDVEALSDNVGIGPGRETLNEYTIVIDAGHGGNDPGKIGVNGEEEKEINLSISKRLKTVLENNGYTVVMTREDDEGLYSPSDSNKKRADMSKRCEIINEAFAQNKKTLCISIHQNSYTSELVKGAQVFYYASSKVGKLLADYIQSSLIKNVDATNTRQAKGNSDYYILIQSSCPTVIIECGFLSNYAEAAKLCNEIYQEKIAEAIYLGLEDFINK